MSGLSRNDCPGNAGIGVRIAPEYAIKKFELTGQISFRQLLLLWQSLDDLKRLYELTLVQQQSFTPTTIDEVLNDEF